MSLFRRKKLYFLILGICSIILGLLIYIVFRENTYISKIIYCVIDFSLIRSLLDPIENTFVKFYLPDYLWAFSLSCWLHIIFMPQSKGSLMCTLTVSLFGSLYEILQYFNIIIGTGDIADAFIYLLAGLTVNILNLKRGSKNEKIS